MNTLLRKNVTVILLVTIASMISMSPLVYALDMKVDAVLKTSVDSSVNMTAWIQAANRLAWLWVIENHSENPVDYNLWSNITRREMLKVMINLSSVTLVQDCEGKFNDLIASDWGCKYAETGLKAGFIAANQSFRPNDMVTEAEALKMIMRAKWFDKAPLIADWSEAYAHAAFNANILASGDSVSSSKSAQRLFTMVVADATVTAAMNLNENSPQTPSQKTYTVTITSTGFIPETITIEAWDKINFVNQDIDRHWPASAVHPSHTSYPGSWITKCGTSDQKYIFDACLWLATGETFSFVFYEKWEWMYHDHLHSSITGKVIVQ